MPGSPPAVEPPEPQAQRSEVSLAAITLRQIRVSRAEVQDKPSSADANPMNRLVPYLDLYGRLADEEIARLAAVPTTVVADLRRQVVQVDRALTRFTDLLPRLTDAELVRLTGATAKTIRFWRLCQPRLPMAGTDAQGWSVAQAAELLGRVQSSAELARRPGGTDTWHAMGEEPPLDSGMPLEPRLPSEPPRMARHPSGESVPAHRMPTAERDGGSAAHRMATAERDGSAAHRAATAERDYTTSSYRLSAAERAERDHLMSSYRMPTAERDAGPASHRAPPADREGSAAYRMPTAERDAGASSHRMTLSGDREGSAAYRMPAAERDAGPASHREGGSFPHRMPTAEREAGRRTADPPSSPGQAPRPPSVPAGAATQPRVPPPPPSSSRPPAPTPQVVQKQQAITPQMALSGAPFPGYDETVDSSELGDDEIVIGLELPDPSTLSQPGRRR